MNGLKVLVVDDNVDSAKMLALMLQLAGHDARAAFDGPSALAVAAGFIPEVVFLDIGMPGMDGYAVAHRLRETPGLENVVLVAMTGFNDPEDRQRARDAGFDHYLVKPADPEEVAKILRRG
jgi:CheY-like chemotaxis protein